MQGSLLITSPRVQNTARYSRAGCISCGLFSLAKTPKFETQGNGKKGIMVIMDCPTKEEDIAGRAYIGKGGEYLEEVFKRCGVDMRDDCWLSYAVSCATNKGMAKLSPQIIEYCRPKIWKEIDKLKPRVIIALGMSVLQSLVGHRWNETSLGSIVRWEGWQIPDRDANAWICPLRNPVHVRIDDKDLALHLLFEKQLRAAINLVNKPLPIYKNEEDCFELLTKYEDINGFLGNILEKKGIIAFDYETTGLRPYRDGMKVICIGVADSSDHAVCFPVKNMDKDLWVRIMQDKEIKKIAHNVQFEDLWTRAFFKTPITGWIFDTELTAHILDCRKGITRLKFQAYVKFGLVDYSSHLDRFIQATAEDEAKYGANAFNAVEKAPLSQLMTYCAIDCITTYRLYKIQKEEIYEDKYD